MNDRYRGIFVTDLDGTLLRDGRITEGDLRAFRSLGDQGIMRVVATGRSLHSAKACLADDFPAEYLILSTGNQIVEWSTQKVMRSSFLSGLEVLEICHFLHGHGLSFMVHEEFPHSHRFEYHRGHKSVAWPCMRTTARKKQAAPICGAPHPRSWLSLTAAMRQCMTASTGNWEI
jgi:hypothetical protein